MFLVTNSKSKNVQQRRKRICDWPKRQKTVVLRKTTTTDELELPVVKLTSLLSENVNLEKNVSQDDGASPLQATKVNIEHTQ